MLRCVLFVLALIAFPCIVLGQETIPISCPAISVTGPAGIVQPGQIALFTMNFGDPNGNPEPKIKWTVTGGVIVSGLNERTVEVRLDGHNSIVATVEVLGLPAGCPTTFSETAPFCFPLPTAEKIGEVRSIDSKAIELESDRVMAEMGRTLDDSRLYIMIGSQSGWTEEDAERLEKSILDSLSGTTGRRILHDTRITMIRCGRDNYPVEFWRVPLGASMPTCSDLSLASQSLKPKTPKVVKCPVGSVTGPSGQVRSGTEINFTANVSDTDLDSLVFRWITSGGKIVGGQGSPWIRVLTTGADNGTTLTAYLTVNGLHDSCSRISEGEAVVQDGGHPLLLDEFDLLSDRDLRQRLKSVATELGRWQNYQLYILSYTIPTEKEAVRTRRQERIRQILIQNGVSPENITYVDGG